MTDAKYVVDQINKKMKGFIIVEAKVEGTSTLDQMVDVTFKDPKTGVFYVCGLWKDAEGNGPGFLAVPEALSI